MIYFFSGKGGVGKSLLAASKAWSLASSGRRTLLVELGERSYYRHIFAHPVDHQPFAVRENLMLVRWAGEACLREYLQHLVKIERVVNLFFDNRIMQALVQAAPALKELALLGKITSGHRRVGPSLEYDDIVVDAYATGHFRALWRAPVGLGQAIPFGPMGDQSRSIVQVLRNPELSKFYVVMTPEELPVSEGLELATDIQRELGQKASLVMNRWLVAPLTANELKAFPQDGFASYLRSLLERQEALFASLPNGDQTVWRVPWLLSGQGQEKVSALAKMEWAQ